MSIPNYMKLSGLMVKLNEDSYRTDFVRRVYRGAFVKARNTYAKRTKFKRKRTRKHSPRLFKHIDPEVIGVTPIDSRNEQFGCNAKRYTFSEFEIERWNSKRQARLNRWPFNRINRTPIEAY